MTGRTFDGPSIADVADMLAERVDAFVPDHLSGAIKTGTHWCAGDVYGSPGQSLRVIRRGPKAGRWKDFSADVQGDLIDLLVANQNINKGEAFKRAKVWLGISDASGQVSTARHAEARTERRVEKALAVSEDDLRKARKIVAIHRQRREGAGTVVEAYRRGRGIVTPVPATLSLLTWHEHPYARRCYPVMLAGVFAPRMLDPQTEKPHETESYDKPVIRLKALHRTYLVVDELEALGERFVFDHRVLELGARATVRRLKFAHNGHDTGKLCLGTMTGGFIPLTASPVKQTLAITEGIENGESIAQVHPEWSVWAAYSASNFRNLIIPHAVSRLILCGDSDNKPARDGQGNIKTHPDGAPIYPADEALKRAAQLHADVAADEGRALEVEIWKPDAGEDANSMLQKGTLT